jgi:hypothetical protein
MCIDPADNELETLQIIHHYVEILDRYFGNVRSSPSLAYFPSSDTHLPYGFCLRPWGARGVPCYCFYPCVLVIWWSLDGILLLSKVCRYLNLSDRTANICYTYVIGWGLCQ